MPLSPPNPELAVRNSLRAFRLCLGVAMISETLLVWSSIDDLYGPYGFLEAGLMNVISGVTAPSFANWFELHGLNYSVCLHLFFLIRLVLLILFTLDRFVPLTTLLLWICQVLIMSSGALSSYGVDRYFHLFLFLLAWQPLIGPKLTLDFARVALLLTYLNAGLAKASGFEWWNGDAIWRVLNLPDFNRVPALWLASVPLLPKLVGWMTIVTETLYPMMIWVPGVNQLWLLAIVSMHLGIAFTMGLTSFGLTMAALNIALFGECLAPFADAPRPQKVPGTLLAH